MSILIDFAMRKLLWILLLLFLPCLSDANQISGYITMKCVGGNTFSATIVDYTIGNPNLDSILINWGDADTSWVHRSNGNGTTVCDSLLMSTYTVVHTYPGYGTYDIWADLGKRVANIANMTNSVGQDFVLFHKITLSAFYANDSIISPTIVNAPVCSYGMEGYLYYFNLDAYSPQSDSLSYTLGNCYNATGYNLPPNVTLGNINDSLIWRSPTSSGLYNFSILITTYKKVIIAGHPHQIPADTTEVELQALIKPAILGIYGLDKSSDDLKLYPNPNNGEFTIQSSSVEKKEVEVYNSLGQKIYSNTFINSQFTIDLSGQSSGIYLYRIISAQGEQVATGKFVVLYDK